jgi:hypothetical protein
MRRQSTYEHRESGYSAASDVDTDRRHQLSGVRALVIVVAVASIVAGCSRNADTRGRPAGTTAGPTTRRSAAPTVNVTTFGAHCDGSTDNTAALQAAVNGAGSRTIVASHGATCLFSHLTISKPVRIDFAGATLKVDVGTTGTFIVIRADDVSFEGGVINGSYAGGGIGSIIEWDGKDGVLSHTTLEHGSNVGLDAASGSVAVNYSTAVDFRNVGFLDEGGTMTTLGAQAHDCGYAGFEFASQAPQGAILDASTSHNGIGAYILSNGGTIKSFVSDDDNNFGLLLKGGASDWTAQAVETDREGQTIRNRSGCGVELWRDSHDDVFDSIISNTNAGFGVALGIDNTHNTFRMIYGDDVGSFNSNPGIALGSGNGENSFSKVTISDYTIGINIGEEGAFFPAPNDDNLFGSVHVYNSSANGVSFFSGSSNRIGALTLVNASSADGVARRNREYGAVNFENGSSDNVIDFLSESGTTDVPDFVAYVGHIGGGAGVPTGNSIASGMASCWSIGVTDDTVGGNTFRLTTSGRPQC